uniref:Uncharacterized protein n=1 Tax=Pithovirus LCPAC001 TaxID=2506585 RepID=A0A481Z3C5_9VIRU|nr:MAG: hypothetical protein LCPAC001_00380 [Pithovirus LCPAC001]
MNNKIYFDSSDLLISDKLILLDTLIKKYPKECQKLIDGIKEQKLIPPSPKTYNQIVKEFISSYDDFKPSDIILSYNEDYEDALFSFINGIICEMFDESWFKISINIDDFCCEMSDCETYENENTVYRLNICYDGYEHFTFCELCKKNAGLSGEYVPFEKLFTKLNKTLYNHFSAIKKS